MSAASGVPLCTHSITASAPAAAIAAAAAAVAVTTPAGVPIIADSKFMAAYSMIEPNAVYLQEDGRNELDVMFSVARMTPEEMWRIRLGGQGGCGGCCGRCGCCAHSSTAGVLCSCGDRTKTLDSPAPAGLLSTARTDAVGEEACWRPYCAAMYACAGLKELRGKMNSRAKDLILGWLKEKGLAPDAQSELGKQAAGHRRQQRRTLLSPLFLLAQAFEQQQQQLVQAAASAAEGWGL